MILSSYKNLNIEIWDKYDEIGLPYSISNLKRYMLNLLSSLNDKVSVGETWGI